MQQQQWVRRRRRRRSQKNATIQKCNAKFKWKNEKNSQNNATKTLQQKLQQSHTKQCNKTKPNKNQNHTKETAQNSETLPLTMRVWVGASLLGWCSKGFWVLLSGFLDFGCKSFFWGVLEKKKNTKKTATIFFYLCKNTNLFYLQKHQSFLSLQTPNIGNARENKEALEYDC